MCALLAPRAARDVISTKPTCAATCVFGLDFNFWPAIKLKPTYPLSLHPPPHAPACLSVSPFFGSSSSCFRALENAQMNRISSCMQHPQRPCGTLNQLLNQSINQALPSTACADVRGQREGERASKLLFGARSKMFVVYFACHK